MQRLIFEKHKKYVTVYQSRDGKHKEARQYNDYVPEYLKEYRIFGIFEMITVRDKSWEKPQNNPEKWNGVPEGKIYEAYRKGYRKTKAVYDQSPKRQAYQEKLRKILSKAKELMALGIDRKAAMQAARKCECHR